MHAPLLSPTSIGASGSLHSPISTLSSPMNGLGSPFSVISSHSMGPHSMASPGMAYGPSVSPQVGPGLVIFFFFYESHYWFWLCFLVCSLKCFPFHLSGLYFFQPSIFPSLCYLTPSYLSLCHCFCSMNRSLHLFVIQKETSTLFAYPLLSEPFLKWGLISIKLKNILDEGGENLNNSRTLYPCSVCCISISHHFVHPAGIAQWIKDTVFTYIQ